MIPTQPLGCADCHDVASSATHAYVNVMLDRVSCIACHDAEGYDVGPDPNDPENGLWTTTLTEVGRAGPTTSAIVSHSIVHDVSCTRCHFEENTWGLQVLTEDGQIPEPEEES
jgi:cytochrome c551/c552